MGDQGGNDSNVPSSSSSTSSSSFKKRKSSGDGGGGEEEVPVTLKEALEDFEELQKVSTAVLGASDPHDCSYSKGYRKRQALYACLTCNPKNAPFFQQAGICLACSYQCHEGHDLVELYTKRNFRCDCGNKRLPDNPCKLQKEKDDYNEKNSYNQNFSGVYCTCHRPYPDPDESTESSAGEMVQCVICEDWYHSEHVIPGVADSDDADNVMDHTELICAGCLPKLEFLGAGAYEHLWIKQKDPSEAEVDVVTTHPEMLKVTSAPPDCDTSSQDSGVGSLPEGSEISSNEEAASKSVEKETQKTESVVSLNDVIASESSGSDGKSVSVCLLDNAKKLEFKPNIGLLLLSGWRREICSCTSCKNLYDKLGVSFLLDEEDSLEAYEAAGQAKFDSEQQKAEESFTQKYNALGRVGQIEFISGINDMKEALGDFLKECGEKNRVIGAEDVQQFFEAFTAKRRRLDLNPQY